MEILFARKYRFHRLYSLWQRYSFIIYISISHSKRRLKNPNNQGNLLLPPQFIRTDVDDRYLEENIVPGLQTVEEISDWEELDR